MMENYEDLRLSAHINSKEIVEVRDVKIQGGDDDFLGYEHSQTNFDFGAEILSTATAATTTTTRTSEEQPKASIEIKTKTFEEQEAAAAEIGAKSPVPPTNCLQNDLEQLLMVAAAGGLPEKSDSEADADATDEEEEDSNEDDSNEEDDSSTDCSSIGPDCRLRWLQREIYTGRVSRGVIASIIPQLTNGPEDSLLWDYLAQMLNEPKRRTKLSYVNTFNDVIDLLQKSEKIIVLTGAGVSVSCGIPDFRSTNGIYARLAHDFPDLPDPQAMFDINYFKRDPRPFYKFAREIYPGEFKPSPCHRFIKMLETKGKLLRNYTQNIDTLEQVAGIQRVIECHGSFSTASCTKCKFKCNADALRADIFAQRIPVCPQCQPNVEQSVDASVAVTEDELRQLVENGIMKPDIVFFGEGLPDEYHTVMGSDKDKCDLLIVIGSSLKVRPVAHIPSSIPGHVPQILINREQLHHLKFDVELLGDSDVIINQICHRLGQDWLQLCYDENVLQESKDLLMPSEPYLHHHHHHHHHHRHFSSESEQPSQLDTDTQSLKSNGSADYMLGSAGTCSDSGFESSTFTTAVKRLPSSAADQAAIERIKTDILGELNEAECERLAAPASHTTTSNTSAESLRHLSIDSSKDSGIAEHYEFSNPGQPASSSFGNNAESTGGGGGPDNVVQETKTAAPSLTPTPPQQKRQSAAERLAPGTFYCHTNNYSYVFPGAQVSWENEYSDDDEEEEDDGDIFGDMMSAEDDDVADLNAVPLSPLMPPSVEAHIVTEIASGNGGGMATQNQTSPSQKRRSSNAVEESPKVENESETPPFKKRRPSLENSRPVTETEERTLDESGADAGGGGGSGGL